MVWDNMKTRFSKVFIDDKLLWPLIPLILILIYNGFFTPNFLTISVKNGRLFGSLIDILKHASPLIIMSIGMTLVIATEGIDISVGAVIAISAAIACSMIVSGQPVFFAIAVALLLSAFCGLFNGVLVAALGIQPMVATLILMTVGRGIAQLITKGQIITISNDTYSYIGNGYFLGLPVSVYIAAVVFIIVYLLLRKTAFGLYIESVGSNRSSARYAGISAVIVIMMAYLLSGLFAGMAGIFISSNVTAADANNAGLWKEIDAILATVIGGTSMMGGRVRLTGTVLGALFIQTLTTTIYATGVPPEIIFVVKAVVVILVTLLQSEVFRGKFKGLIHRKETGYETGKVIEN